MLPVLLTILLGSVVFLGLGWLGASRLALAPAERLLASAVLSGIAVYLLAFGGYALDLPPSAAPVYGLLALLALAAGRRQLVPLLRDPLARQILCGWAIVTAATLVLLWSIPSFSGGAWFLDFEEHWERTLYWLQHWPLHTTFLDQYSITSRPPLVNLEIAALLGATPGAFGHFELLMSLTASLAFLPAALLARRWGGDRAVPRLTVLVLVSPVFLVNATYPWTKLQAAFWILSAIYFLLRARDKDAPPAALALAGLSMGAGVLAHYSAIPFALALVLAWLVAEGGRRETPRRVVRAALPGLALAATWFGWAFARFGLQGTLLSTTTTSTADPSKVRQLARILLNAVDTFVPTFLGNRTMDPWLRQTSGVGHLRDIWFQLAHANLLLSVGSSAGVIALIAAWHARRSVDAATRRFWVAFVALALGLGIAASGERQPGGVAHICLVSLALLGVAFLAGRWDQLSRALRRWLVVGFAVDLGLGVLLQFFVQSWTADRWLRPGLADREVAAAYSRSTLVNFDISRQMHEVFLPGLVAFQPLIALALLLLIAALAATRLRGKGIAA